MFRWGIRSGVSGCSVLAAELQHPAAAVWSPGHRQFRQKRWVIWKNIKVALCPLDVQRSKCLLTFLITKKVKICPCCVVSSVPNGQKVIAVLTFNIFLLETSSKQPPKQTLKEVILSPSLHEEKNILYWHRRYTWITSYAVWVAALGPQNFKLVYTVQHFSSYCTCCKFLIHVSITTQ